MTSFLRKLTIAALLMSIVMTVLSAYIRLSDSGIGCDPWPACFGAGLSVDQTPGIIISTGESNKGLRVFHRIIASVFGIVAIVLFIVALWYRRRLESSPVMPGVILLLTVVLALIGMSTPDLVHPLIATINLSGGMLLAAVLYHYFLYLTDIKRAPLTLTSISLLLGSVLVFLSIVSGAWTSANFAAGSCEGFLSCPSGDPALAFDADRQLALDQGRLVRDNEMGLIMQVHHLLSVVVAIVVLFISFTALIRGQSYAFIYLIILVCLMLPAVVPITSVVVANLHNVFSLLLLLTLVHQFHQSRAAPI